MPEAELFMLRVTLDTARLLQEGMGRRLPLRDVDLGYLAHAWLDGAFGPGVVRPFSARDLAARGQGSRSCEVLGYAAVDGAALRAHADAFAAPQLHAAADWDRFAVKRMPAGFQEGTRLGFEVMVCPTVRNAQRPAERQRGVEVDAFLAASWRAPGEPLERAEVYAGWLAQRFERSGAALRRCQMTDFQLAPMLRRTQGEDRKARIKRFPRATLSGTLEVTEREGFAALLAGGVGRHKAFGFGMLLLRPAQGG